jgi:hypothetical protein
MPTNETITLSEGEVVVYELSARETFENVLIDQTAPGASYTILAPNVPGFTIRNVGFLGAGQGGQDGDPPSSAFHLQLAGQGEVEGVYLNAKNPDADATTGGMWFSTGHAAHVDVRHCYVAGMARGGIRYDAPAYGSGGTVTVTDTYCRDNTIANVLLGTEGGVLRRCVSVLDDPQAYRSPAPAGGFAAVGIEARGAPDMLIDRSSVWVSADDFDHGAAVKALHDDRSLYDTASLSITESAIKHGDGTRFAEQGAQISTDTISDTPTVQAIHDGVPLSAKDASDGVYGLPAELPPAGGGFIGTNDPPVANIDVSTDGPTVALDARNSTDPDGTIATYNWELDGESYTGAQVNHTFSSNGTHTVTLEVVDMEGTTTTATTDVTVDGAGGTGQDGIGGGKIAAGAALAGLAYRILSD